MKSLIFGHFLTYRNGIFMGSNLIQLESYHLAFMQKKPLVSSENVTIPHLTFLPIFPRKAISSLGLFFSTAIEMRAFT